MANNGKPPGRWQKGQSGNPGGRPKVIAEIREIANRSTKDMIAVLVSIANDEKASPSARVAAANCVLDRALGKPPQSLEHIGAGMTFTIVTGIERSPDQPLVIEAKAEEVRH